MSLAHLPLKVKLNLQGINQPLSFPVPNLRYHFFSPCLHDPQATRTPNALQSPASSSSIEQQHLRYPIEVFFLPQAEGIKQSRGIYITKKDWDLRIFNVRIPKAHGKKKNTFPSNSSSRHGLVMDTIYGLRILLV